MIWLPSFQFEMGGHEWPDPGPAHPVAVSGFWMDEHEVAVHSFVQFCRETGWAVPVGLVSQQSSMPALVSWTDAEAYCRHYGKRLPTEAEFERAYRGGQHGVTYPWGNDPTPSEVIGNLPDRRLAERLEELQFRRTALESLFLDYDDGWVGLAPVKSFPPDSQGFHDLVGNAWEWCSDWYDDDYYRFSPRVDPKGPPSRGTREIVIGGPTVAATRREPAWKVIRGGSYDGVRENFRCAFRTTVHEESVAGFRGVTDLTPGAR